MGVLRIATGLLVTAFGLLTALAAVVNLLSGTFMDKALPAEILGLQINGMFGAPLSAFIVAFGIGRFRRRSPAREIRG